MPCDAAARQQTASNDLIIEGFGRIGAKRILTNKPEELTEAQPTFRPNRHRKDWIFNEGHRRQPWHSNRTGMIWRHALPAPAIAAREPQFRSITRLFNDSKRVDFLYAASSGFLQYERRE